MAASFDESLLGGINALIAGDPRRAVLLLEPLLRVQPFHPILHFDLAVAYRLRGLLPYALGHARVACELLDSAAAHALYGVHLHLARSRAQAREQLAVALGLDPAYRLAQMYLALLDREEGRRDEAIALLTRALAPGPGALPQLVAERVKGQRFDLERSEEPPAPADTLWCSVSVVTEILLMDGAALSLEPVVSPPRFEVTPAPSRLVSPEDVALRLHRASRVVALTGAGISSASGLSTRKELWQRFDRDMAVSAIGVAQDPLVLWSVVRDFLSGEAGSSPVPNVAHDVLARLPRMAAILTQNVDDLHQRAALQGSAARVHELHGTLERMVCSRCGKRSPHPARHYVASYLVPPWCEACQGVLRPDVVLFGEQVAQRDLTKSLEAVEGCDLLLVVGCAMDVAPASELPRMAAGAGAKVIEIKRSPSRISDAICSELLLGPAEETLPRVYAALAALESLPPLPQRLGARPAPPASPPVLPILLPPLGESVVEATLARWVRQPGDRVEQGDVIAEFDTDKVCIEIPAPVSGVLRRLWAGPHTPVPVHGPIADIEPLEGAALAGALPQAPPLPRRASLAEVKEPQEALFVPLGPHAALVRAGIMGLDEARWLTPEHSPALRDRVGELVDQHRHALGLAPARLWFSEDRREVLETWKKAWLLPGTGPQYGLLRPFDVETAAWSEAMDVSARRTRQRGGKLRLLEGLVGSRVRPRLAGHRAHEHNLNYVSASCALTELLGLWLARLVAQGVEVDPPCPFTPLLDLFRLGAWPFVLPSAVMGIYLPHPGQLEEDTASERVSTHGLRSFSGLRWIPDGRRPR